MKTSIKILICTFIVTMIIPLNVYMAEFNEAYYQNTEPVNWTVDAIAARVSTNGTTEVIKKQTDRVIGRWYRMFLAQFGLYGTGVTGTDEQVFAYMWIDKDYKGNAKNVSYYVKIK